MIFRRRRAVVSDGDRVAWLMKSRAPKSKQGPYDGAQFDSILNFLRTLEEISWEMRFASRIKGLIC
jgi:hypothetical protein